MIMFRFYRKELLVVLINNTFLEKKNMCHGSHFYYYRKIQYNHMK